MSPPLTPPPTSFGVTKLVSFRPYTWIVCLTILQMQLLFLFAFFFSSADVSKTQLMRSAGSILGFLFDRGCCAFFFFFVLFFLRPVK